MGPRLLTGEIHPPSRTNIVFQWRGEADRSGVKPDPFTVAGPYRIQTGIPLAPFSFICRKILCCQTCDGKEGPATQEMIVVAIRTTCTKLEANIFISHNFV